MARVLDEILYSFYEKLFEADTVDQKTIEALRALFEAKKRYCQVKRLCGLELAHSPPIPARKLRRVEHAGSV